MHQYTSVYADRYPMYQIKAGSALSNSTEVIKTLLKTALLRRL